jgi:Transposase IS116/IS110/IS902 family
MARAAAARAIPTETVEVERRESVRRLTRDLVAAAGSLGEKEARFLVDAYYISQDDRKRASQQVLAMEGEPHQLLSWLADQNATLENQIKRALEVYANATTVGAWMMAQHGIGPVIAAGLMAHIDIDRAITAGHIWRYAGLDPTVKWEKKQKRPWNAQLKTLCWKIGQSFMKFSGAEECVYGHLYRQRKEFEVARNERGENGEAAARILSERNIGKDTDAFKHLTGGKLPPAQIDARARRYAVKIFLSHLQCVWWFAKNGELPGKPYALAHADHVHFIEPPHADMIDGLVPALKAAHWL